MTMEDALTTDPFIDQGLSEQTSTQDSAPAESSTLVLGRNVSLTLATDSLIVLGTRLISLLMDCAHAT